jgi:indolepyruvate decarboxylase
MTQTVIEHVLRRLKTFGIEDIFGVPGDYAFSVQDAIVHDPHISWVGCCNELNPAYAADGYARIRGVGALNPICGVGELSALNGMAGAPRWADFLEPDDILIAETGTSSMGLAFARMPIGVTFQNQTLWGSIGWATPAAFGAAVAAPDRRVILVTGDGSHQLTAQEISQFGRYGLKPIVFVLNNSGYLIERLLCADPNIAYNDIASWRYSELPRALGCDDWFTARVATCGELDQALTRAARGDTAAYIEVVTDTYAAPPMAVTLHDHTTTLDQS